MPEKLMKIASMVACFVLVVMLSACNGGDLEAMVAEGDRYMAEQNYQGAIVIYKTVLEKDPGRMAARLGLGRAYLMSGKIELAETNLEKYRKQNPYDKSVLIDMARLHASMGRNLSAQESLGEFLEAFPDSAEGHEAKGILDMADKNPASAEAELLRALQIEPGRVSASVVLAKVYAEQKRFDEATPIVRSVLEKDPVNKGALYLDASIAAATGNEERMMKAYATLAETYPNEAIAEYMVAKGMLSRKEYDRADTVGQGMIGKFPAEPYGLKIRGLVAFFRGEYASAITFFSGALNKRRDVESFFYLGLSHYGSGNLESALTELRMAADGAPGDTRSLEMISLIYLQQGRIAESIAEAEKVIALNPENAVARTILSDALVASGNSEKALQELERVTELKPEDYGASIKKGLLHMSMGDMGGTEDALQAALNSAPDNTRPRLVLASFYLRSGNRAKAMQTLEQGLNGSPEDASLYIPMARMLLLENKRQEAVGLLAKAKAADPADPAAYSTMATIRLAENDAAGAMAEYDTLLANRPEYADALLQKAAILEAMGRQEDADACYTAALPKGGVKAHFGYAASLIKRGDAEGALSVVERGLALVPLESRLVGLKADLLLRLKRFEDVLALCRDMEMRQSGSSVGLEIRTRLMMGDAKGAQRVARQLCEFSPRNPEGYQALANVHLASGQIDEAVAALEEGVEKAGPEPGLFLALGKLHAGKGDMDKAIAYLDAALKRDPKFVVGHTAKGDVLMAQGKRDKAIESYTKALEIADAFVPALNNLAMVYADMPGKAPESLRLAYTAYSRAPWDPSVLDTFGYSFIRNGKHDEAVKVLEKAAQIAGDNPTVLYHLGLAYSGAGNAGRAREVLQECLKHAGPKEAEAANALLKSL